MRTEINIGIELRKCNEWKIETACMLSQMLRSVYTRESETDSRSSLHDVLANGKSELED